VKSGRGSRELRNQASPRRRTWTKRALARADWAREMTCSMSAGELREVLKVSAQKARYSERGAARRVNGRRRRRARGIF
jgi:hypothetical protein